MPVIDGAMQDYALTLDRFLGHAAKWHPQTEVVTALDEGAVQRIGYEALHARAKRVSAVLAGLGVSSGDRVATLAWNSQEHVESWFAIMGMGAVCHTLNPRLTAEQLAWMVGQSEARILLASADLAGLAHEILDRAPALGRVLVLDGEAPELGKRLDSLLAEATDEIAWGDADNRSPAGLCFTSGTTGAPKGVTYTHRSNYLHTIRALQADAMARTTEDRVLVAVPMFHANAWGLPFAAPAAGARPGPAGPVHADGASPSRG